MTTKPMMSRMSLTLIVAAMLVGALRQPAYAQCSQTNGTTYNCGEVMRGTINVYYIWYGNWPATDSAVPILKDFASHIGGSPYLNGLTTYHDSAAFVQNSVRLAQSVTAPLLPGTNLMTSLSSDNIWSIVKNAIDSGTMVLDANGIYFVLTSKDVPVTGFGTSFCGKHWSRRYGPAGSPEIKYALVGDPTQYGGCVWGRYVPATNTFSSVPL